MRVAIDDRAVQRALEALGDREARAAIARSLNRTAVGVKTKASREIRAAYAIKARDLNAETLQINRATASKAFADIRAKAALIPLTRFGSPRQTRKGVTVTVRKGGKRMLLPRSFLATGRADIREAFWRIKDGAKLVPRGPTKLLFGPAVVQLLGANNRVKELLEYAKLRLVDELRNDIRRRIQNRAERALR